MTAHPNTAVAVDREWCHDVISNVSRTFAITVDRLEEPMATDVCVSYLCCRIADTVEDAGHVPPVEQTALLTAYLRVLDPDDSFTAERFLETIEPWLPAEGTDEWDRDWQLVAETPRVVRTFEALDPRSKEAVRAPIRELVDGMATFTDRYADEGGLRLQTVSELEEYCWYVAGTVGTLVTGLLEGELPDQHARKLASNARSFALLLQLVNVAKDVEDDYHSEGNVYLPGEWLAAENVHAEEVTAPENRHGVAAVVRRVASRAETYLDDAQQYLELLPEHRGNTLDAWAIPYLLAVGTLRELRDRPMDVFHDGDVKVSREEVYTLLRRFDEGVDRTELAELRATIASRPLHLVD